MADNIISNNSGGIDLCGSQVFKNASPLTPLPQPEALSTSPLPPLTSSTSPPPALHFLPPFNCYLYVHDPSLPASTFFNLLCNEIFSIFLSSVHSVYLLQSLSLPYLSLSASTFLHFLQASCSFFLYFPSIPLLTFTSFYFSLLISSLSFDICFHFPPL